MVCNNFESELGGEEEGLYVVQIGGIQVGSRIQSVNRQNFLVVVSPVSVGFLVRVENEKEPFKLIVILKHSGS